MTTALKVIFLVMHFAGIVGLLVGVTAAMVKRLTQARAAVWHSSTLMLLSGIGLVAVDSLAKDDISHSKVGVKFAVLLVISVLAFRLNRGAKTAKDSGPTTPYFIIGLLTIANVLIAATL
ncbi:MAG: hypothetical protein EBU85_04840 [Actinobacteria bacterium]|nr:hypothetical protein [Actinomycetota bacterium]